MFLSEYLFVLSECSKKSLLIFQIVSLEYLPMMKLLSEIFCLYVYISLSISIYLSIFLSIIYLPIYQFIYLFINLSGFFSGCTLGSLLCNYDTNIHMKNTSVIELMSELKTDNYWIQTIIYVYHLLGNLKCSKSNR